MTEDSGSKWIRAARAARQFNVLLPAVADGRLNLSAVVLLAPHLAADNVRELIDSAARKSFNEIRHLLADRAPKLDLSAPPTSFDESNVPELSRLSVVQRIDSASSAPPEPAHPPVTSANVVHAPPPAPPPSTRRAVILTLDDELNSLLSRAVELLGYKLRSGEPKEVFRRSLRHFVTHLERTAINEPRPSTQTQDTNSRYIPTRVRAAVWKRDRARCTFVSESGHQCAATKDLEFDHIVPLALGGATSAGNLRLRCHAHNQYAAECVFGREFMESKRRAALGSTA
jgi:5-methylcytosine-specific restriction endonuclease McrA